MTENIDFPPPALVARNGIIRFTNWPLGSKRFRTIRRCNVDVARLLVAAGGGFVAATKSKSGPYETPRLIGGCTIRFVTWLFRDPQVIA